MKNFERNTAWVLLFSLTIMLTVQIIARYIFFTSINWIEEFSRIIFIWFIYLSISWIITQGRHIRVTALDLIMPESASWVPGLAPSAKWRIASILY